MPVYTAHPASFYALSLDPCRQQADATSTTNSCYNLDYSPVCRCYLHYFRTHTAPVSSCRYFVPNPAYKGEGCCGGKRGPPTGNAASEPEADVESGGAVGTEEPSQGPSQATTPVPDGGSAQAAEAALVAASTLEILKVRPSAVNGTLLLSSSAAADAGRATVNRWLECVW